MARLIVTRPRVSRLEWAASRYQILIDGEHAATVTPGTRVEIPLEPGAHRIRARAGFANSPPVEILAGQEETHLLATGPSQHYNKLLRIGASAAMLPPLAFLCWSLSQRASALDDGWYFVFFLPAFLLPNLIQLVMPWFLRNLTIALREIPDPTLTDPQVVVFLDAQARRVRLSIRQMMIAVALFAIYLGVSVEWARGQRSDFFHGRADLHARHEQLARDAEERVLKHIRSAERRAADFEKRSRIAEAENGPDAQWRRMEARSAANADYHAAMKRKYEEAAARGWLTVEPDPPEPPWP